MQLYRDLSTMPLNKMIIFLNFQKVALEMYPFPFHHLLILIGNLILGRCYDLYISAGRVDDFIASWGILCGGALDLNCGLMPLLQQPFACIQLLCKESSGYWFFAPNSPKGPQADG